MRLVSVLSSLPAKKKPQSDKGPMREIDRAGQGSKGLLQGVFPMKFLQGRTNAKPEPLHQSGLGLHEEVYSGHAEGALNPRNSGSFWGFFRVCRV